MIRLGIDRLLAEPQLRQALAGRRVALLAHPASVTHDLTHSLDALARLPELKLSAAFGPQHGLRGDKQDNMVESPDFIDPVLGIPTFSLYGTVRRLERADARLLRCAAGRPAGCGLPHLYLHHDATLRARAGRGRLEGRVGAGPPQSRGSTGGRVDACEQAGEFRRRRGTADASRSDTRRARALVRAHAPARRRLPRSGDAGLGRVAGTGLWLADRAAQLGQSQSQRSDAFDGALLCRARC